MTPNELRLGNLVKIRDTGEIVRVCGLLEDYIRCQRKGQIKSWQAYPNDRIEPVLIFDYWQKISSTYCNLQWLPDWGEEESLCYDYDGVTISYIHELQNLHYALTGDELKIEL